MCTADWPCIKKEIIIIIIYIYAVELFRCPNLPLERATPVSKFSFGFTLFTYASLVSKLSFIVTFLQHRLLSAGRMAFFTKRSDWKSDSVCQFKVTLVSKFWGHYWTQNLATRATLKMVMFWQFGGAKNSITNRSSQDVAVTAFFVPLKTLTFWTFVLNFEAHIAARATSNSRCEPSQIQRTSCMLLQHEEHEHWETKSWAIAT